MKSIKFKKQIFTMEDFEQGLMLAGIVTPSSIKELHEKEMLREYELLRTKEPGKKDNIFFKRVTLAAEIVSQMHEEPTFGRIKFQKLMYLCEHAALMDLNERYQKQAAGPFDNKFMHSIMTQFKKNKWFDVETKRDGTYHRSVYVQLEKADDYKKYYDSYFKSEHEKIQYILDLFRTIKTDTTEIAATLYFCAVELNNEKKEVTDLNLLEKFYKWSEAKSRFSENTVRATWEWMVKKNIIPSI
jgi:hypothetical protein